MGNQMKVTQDSMSQHNMANPDNLKLVNYTYKVCNARILQILVGKNLMIQHPFVRHFHRQSFTLHGITLIKTK